MTDKPTELTDRSIEPTTITREHLAADPITEKVNGPSSQARTSLPPPHVKFPDLASAGRDLATRLDNYFGSEEETLIIAIARGGVPAAVEVAKHFGMPLDIILLRRLLAPRGPGSEICAVNVCGTLVIDPELALPTPAPTTPLEYFVADALEGLAIRERACRGGRTPLEVARKNVLLIDNGIHTGSTVLAAIRALRTMKPSRLVVAVPVAALASQAAVEAAADEVVCLTWPERFGHVGLWYVNFNVPDAEQIRNMLDQIPPNTASKFSPI